MKIVYDTPKKEFEPFSIRIESLQDAKLITELLRITQTQRVYNMGGSNYAEALEIDNKLSTMYKTLCDLDYDK